MWIHTEKGFLSIVEDRNNPSLLLCRARYEGDIERIFGEDAKVEENAGTDYRYRSYLPREQVSAAIHKITNDISYPNFKDRMDEVNFEQHCDGSAGDKLAFNNRNYNIKQTALLNVWTNMVKSQNYLDPVVSEWYREQARLKSKSK